MLVIVHIWLSQRNSEMGISVIEMEAHVLVQHYSKTKVKHNLKLHNPQQQQGHPSCAYRYIKVP